MQARISAALTSSVRLHESRNIDRFVRALRGQYQYWTLGLTLAAHGLVLGVALCIVDILAPSWLTWAAVAAGIWLLGVAAWTLLRLRPPLAEADRQLGLRDGLVTYLGLAKGPAQTVHPGFADWLAADLEDEVAAMPDAPKNIWRRPLGQLRYLLPVLVVLLLLRSFSPLGPQRPDDEGPPLASGGGGGGGGPGESGGGGGGQQPSPESPQPEPDPQSEEESDEPEQPPPNEPPDPQEGSGGALPPPEPPPEMNVVDEFVVPQFIDEGPTRKELAKQAIMEEGAGTDPQQAPRAAGREGQQTPPDTPADPDFDKAYEQAMRARHVPPEERSFVKAYFEALRKAGKAGR